MERDSRYQWNKTCRRFTPRPSYLLLHVGLVFLLHSWDWLDCSSILKRVIFCCVVNIVASVAELGTLSFYILYVAGSPTLLCILGNYLLIHLKEAGEIGLNEGTSYRFDLNSSMNFGQEQIGDTMGRSMVPYTYLISHFISRIHSEYYQSLEFLVTHVLST